MTINNELFESEKSIDKMPEKEDDLKADFFTSDCELVEELNSIDRDMSSYNTEERMMAAVREFEDSKAKVYTDIDTLEDLLSRNASKKDNNQIEKLCNELSCKDDDILKYIGEDKLSCEKIKDLLCDAENRLGKFDSPYLNSFNEHEDIFDKELEQIQYDLRPERNYEEIVNSLTEEELKIIDGRIDDRISNIDELKSELDIDSRLDDKLPVNIEEDIRLINSLYDKLKENPELKDDYELKNDYKELYDSVDKYIKNAYSEQNLHDLTKSERTIEVEMSDSEKFYRANELINSEKGSVDTSPSLYDEQKERLIELLEIKKDLEAKIVPENDKFEESRQEILRNIPVDAKLNFELNCKNHFLSEIADEARAYKDKENKDCNDILAAAYYSKEINDYLKEKDITIDELIDKSKSDKFEDRCEALEHMNELGYNFRQVNEFSKRIEESGIELDGLNELKNEISLDKYNDNLLELSDRLNKDTHPDINDIHSVIESIGIEREPEERMTAKEIDMRISESNKELTLTESPDRAAFIEKSKALYEEDLRKISEKSLEKIFTSVYKKDLDGAEILLLNDMKKECYQIDKYNELGQSLYKSELSDMDKFLYNGRNTYCMLKDEILNKTERVPDPSTKEDSLNQALTQYTVEREKMSVALKELNKDLSPAMLEYGSLRCDSIKESLDYEMKISLSKLESSRENIKNIYLELSKEDPSKYNPDDLKTFELTADKYEKALVVSKGDLEIAKGIVLETSKFETKIDNRKTVLEIEDKKAAEIEKEEKQNDIEKEKSLSRVIVHLKDNLKSFIDNERKSKVIEEKIDTLELKKQELKEKISPMEKIKIEIPVKTDKEIEDKIVNKIISERESKAPSSVIDKPIEKKIVSEFFERVEKDSLSRTLSDELDSAKRVKSLFGEVASKFSNEVVYTLTKCENNRKECERILNNPSLNKIMKKQHVDDIEKIRFNDSLFFAYRHMHEEKLVTDLHDLRESLNYSKGVLQSEFESQFRAIKDYQNVLFSGEYGKLLDEGLRNYIANKEIGFPPDSKYNTVLNDFRVSCEKNQELYDNLKKIDEQYGFDLASKIRISSFDEIAKFRVDNNISILDNNREDLVDNFIRNYEKRETILTVDKEIQKEIDDDIRKLLVKREDFEMEKGRELKAIDREISKLEKNLTIKYGESAILPKEVLIKAYEYAAKYNIPINDNRFNEWKKDKDEIEGLKQKKFEIYTPIADEYEKLLKKTSDYLDSKFSENAVRDIETLRIGDSYMHRLQVAYLQEFEDKSIIEKDLRSALSNKYGRTDLLKPNRYTEIRNDVIRGLESERDVLKKLDRYETSRNELKDSDLLVESRYLSDVANKYLSKFSIEDLSHFVKLKDRGMDITNYQQELLDKYCKSASVLVDCERTRFMSGDNVDPSILELNEENMYGLRNNFNSSIENDIDKINSNPNHFQREKTVIDHLKDARDNIKSTLDERYSRVKDKMAESREISKAKAREFVSTYNSVVENIRSRNENIKNAVGYSYFKVMEGIAQRIDTRKEEMKHEIRDASNHLFKNLNAPFELVEKEKDLVKEERTIVKVKVRKVKTEQHKYESLKVRVPKI